VKLAILLAAIGAGIYILPYAIIGFVIGKALYDRNFESSSHKNARGNEAKAEVNLIETPYHMVITLRRFHWFSTTLLEAWSADFSVAMKWLDNDTLVLQLDFGPASETTRPIDHVGPIHVDYRFVGKGAIGDPDIEPFSTCPPPYPSPYWHCERMPPLATQQYSPAKW
jgi:hypothetical protein